MSASRYGLQPSEPAVLPEGSCPNCDLGKTSTREGGSTSTAARQLNWTNSAATPVAPGGVLERRDACVMSAPCPRQVSCLAHFGRTFWTRFFLNSRSMLCCTNGTRRMINAHGKAARTFSSCFVSSGSAAMHASAQQRSTARSRRPASPTSSPAATAAPPASMCSTAMRECSLRGCSGLSRWGFGSARGQAGASVGASRSVRRSSVMRITDRDTPAMSRELMNVPTAARSTWTCFSAGTRSLSRRQKLVAHFT